jgi:hypothetical protein
VLLLCLNVLIMEESCGYWQTLLMLCCNFASAACPGNLMTYAGIEDGEFLAVCVVLLQRSPRVGAGIC